MNIKKKERCTSPKIRILKHKNYFFISSLSSCICLLSLMMDDALQRISKERERGKWRRGEREYAATQETVIPLQHKRRSITLSLYLSTLLLFLSPLLFNIIIHGTRPASFTPEGTLSLSPPFPLLILLPSHLLPPLFHLSILYACYITTSSRTSIFLLVFSFSDACLHISLHLLLSLPLFVSYSLLSYF